jgi:uncharacterized integral membrane protein (TIGR02327 family)
MTKWVIYLFMTGLTLYGLESINLSVLFKKNKVLQARIMYILIAFSFAYLSSSFLIEFLEASTTWFIEG